MSFIRFLFKVSFTRRTLGIFILLIFLTLACSLGGVVSELAPQPDESSPVPEDSLPATESPPLDSESSSAGACSNLYYPVVDGVSHTYQASSTIGDPFSIVDTISDVTPDGFTLSSLIGTVARTQQWACKPDGLTLLDYNGGGSATLSAEGLTAQYTTLNVTGVTIPTAISPGDAWSQEFQIEGTQSMPGDQTAFSEGTVLYQFQAVGMENVSVPAGSFDAMKLEVATTLNFTSTFQEVTVPVSFASSGFAWYAPGIGWVKTVDESDFFGQSSTTTIELISYSIP